MSDIFFQPWVGKHYGSRFGKRVLILGEAHYQWDKGTDQYPELTQEAIRAQMSGEYTYAFWTRVAGAFIGHKPDLEEKGEFWQSVAFYNYVQEFVGFGPKLAPTPEMWSRSVPGFVELLDRLSPQAIIVMGYRLWNHVPDLDGSADFAMDDGKGMRTWRYPLKHGGSALAYPIRHPSSGFNGAKWHPFIRKAIVMA